MKKCFIGSSNDVMVKVSRKAPKICLSVLDIEDVESILRTPDENGGVMFNEERWHLVVELSTVALVKKYCRKVYYRSNEFILDTRSNHIYDILVAEDDKYYYMTESYKVM